MQLQVLNSLDDQTKTKQPKAASPLSLRPPRSTEAGLGHGLTDPIELFSDISTRRCSYQAHGHAPGAGGAVGDLISLTLFTKSESIFSA